MLKTVSAHYCHQIENFHQILLLQVNFQSLEA